MENEKGKRGGEWERERSGIGGGERGGEEEKKKGEKKRQRGKEQNEGGECGGTNVLMYAFKCKASWGLQL